MNGIKDYSTHSGFTVHLKQCTQWHWKTESN